MGARESVSESEKVKASGNNEKVHINQYHLAHRCDPHHHQPHQCLPTTYAHLNLAYDSLVYFSRPFVRNTRERIHRKAKRNFEKKLHHRSIEMNICDPFPQPQRNEKRKKFKA